jgi:hypothetical protein
VTVRRTGALLRGLVLVSGCGQVRVPGPSGRWTLAGKPVSGQQVESSAGPEHCGWQDAQFLLLSWPPGRTHDDPRRLRTYVKDPHGVLGSAPSLREGYQADTALPGDAVDTGYRNDGYALWYSRRAADSRVYLVRGEGEVESWPRATSAVGCD